MTRGQFRTLIQGDLFDSVGVYFTNDIVNNSIQEGYDQVVCASQCIEKTISINWIPGQIYYDLYNTIPQYSKPTKILNYDTNRWTDFTDSRFLDKYRFDWEVSNGASWFSYLVNYQYLGFFPHAGGVGGSNFLLMYKVFRDTLVSDSSPLQVPSPYFNTITNYCIADLLESIHEFTKAKGYFDDFSAELNLLRSHVTSRMSPERYLQLNDLDFPYPTLP